MKIIRFLLLISFLVGLVKPSQAARADEGDSPWGDFLNLDGSIRWDQLVDLGTISEPADWMDITLPGDIVVDLDATYHRYQTPTGNIVVLPSPATLFFMAMHPVDSGLSSADSMLGDGASILAMLVGPSMTSDQLAQLATHGYTDTREFFQAVIDGRENIWSIINRAFFFEIMKMSFDSGFLVNAILLYLNGVADCTNIPGGCPVLAGEDGDGDGLPDASECPGPTISQAPARLTIQKIAPENPLVVGQDPEKRGADIQASVTIPPVIFTWYEQKPLPPVCEYDEVGNEFNCEVEYECIQHVETLPEPITEVQANAQLNAESRYWILNDLASKYYEAYIHKPRFNLVPEMAQMEGGCGSNSTCSAETQVPNVPFADPGTFDLRMWVSTAGTVFNWNGVSIPITQPRVLTTQDAMQVYVTLVTLLPAGAP